MGFSHAYKAGFDRSVKYARAGAHGIFYPDLSLGGFGVSCYFSVYN